MKEHQKRVVEEKLELDKKATKMSKFIGSNAIFEDINPEEQERMKEQCETMWEYSEILGERIAAFITTECHVPLSSDKSDKELI